MKRFLLLTFTALLFTTLMQGNVAIAQTSTTSAGSQATETQRFLTELQNLEQRLTNEQSREFLTKLQEFVNLGRLATPEERNELSNMFRFLPPQPTTGAITSSEAMELFTRAKANNTARHDPRLRTPEQRAEYQNFANNPGGPIPNVREPSCGSFDILCGLRYALAWVALILVVFFGWLFSAAGLVLDTAIQYFVLGFSSLVIDRGFGIAISDIWTVIRDLVNLSFIFALLYIGITTIVQGGSETKRLLVGVIISALLVNFSLYFAKAIIDLANIISITIAKAIAGNTTSFENIAISGRIREMLSIRELIDLRNNQEVINQWATWSGLFNVFLYALGASVLIFKMTFAFAFAGILIIIRFFALIFLMIFSPLAFLPKGIPGLGEASQQWWSTLIGQAFFAPAFLFGVYVAMKIISVVKIDGSRWVHIFKENGASAAAPIILYYILAVVSIIMATVMAKKLADQGALRTLGLVDRVEKMVRGTIGMGTSFVGRNTVGKQASRLLDSHSSMVRRILSNRFIGREVGNTLNTLKKAQYGGGYSYQDDADWRKRVKFENNAAERARNAHKNIENGRAILNQLQSAPPASFSAMSPAQQGGIKDMLDVIKGLTKAELEHTSVQDLTNPQLATFLSASQMDSIKSSDAFTSGEKAAIQKARVAGINSMITKKVPGAPDQPIPHGIDILFEGKNTSEIAQLPASILTTSHVAERLSQPVLQALVRAGTLQDHERTAIRNAINARCVNLTARGIPLPRELEVAQNWLTNTAAGQAF